MADMQDRIHDYLAAAEDKGFAGAVLVERGGEVIFERGYGLADRANVIPVDSSTIFNIGHLTRHFTVAAVLRLLEQGDLTLSTTLGDLFPNCPSDKAVITVAQLLRHEAGISPRAGSYRYDFVPREQFLRELFREPLAHAPGSRSDYANAGYILLAAIVERASGQGFEDYLREAFFLPAGMSATGYVLPEWGGAVHARSYFFDIAEEAWVDWGTTLEQFGFEGVSWYAIGKGDMLSSARDLLAWHRALRERRVLSAASQAALAGYLRLEQPADTSYYVEAANGHAHADYLSEEGHTVLLLSSVDRAAPMAREILRLATRADHAPSPFSADPYELLFEFMRGHTPADVDGLPQWFEANGAALDDPGLLNPVGIMQMNKGRHDWAVALLTLNVRLFPDEGNFWDNLGEAYLAAGERGKAADSFREALRHAPPGDCMWCMNARTRLEALDAGP